MILIGPLQKNLRNSTAGTDLMDTVNENNLVIRRIGDRIKEIRHERGMTQKELAGGTVSRNMLSMIESGAAVPSIETLLSLAKSLSVTPAYFFAGEDELALYSKKDAVQKLHQYLSAGDFESTAELCSEYASNDAEMRQYLVLAYLNIAKDHLDKYMLGTATKYLRQAADAARSLPYGAECVIGMCNYAITLTECVSKDTIPDILTDSEFISQIPIPAEFNAYIYAYKAIPDGNADIASAIARSGILNKFLSLHIRGAVLMRSEDFEGAARILDLALSSDDGGFYSRYKLICDLEVCRKHLGDFEMAYSLSTGRMEMLGMFSK